MSCIDVRDLLKIPHREMWDYRDEFKHIRSVKLDDGEYDIRFNKLIMSRYAWVYHELYPDLPLTKDHVHFSNYFKPNSLSQILNAGLWDCYDYQENKSVWWREEMCEHAYVRINHLYNDLSIYGSEYVRGMDAADYLDIMRHPTIAELRHTLQTAVRVMPITFVRAYEKAKKVILGCPTLNDNPLAIAARCNSVKIDQVLQLIVGRGYCSDADSRIFPNGVRYAYMDGIYGVENVLIDSRSATKAIYYQKGPTQQSEYLNRRLQMEVSVIKRLRYEPCDTTTHVNTYMNSKSKLSNYAGKHYWDDDGVLRTISANDDHLIGKFVKMRMVASCTHNDRYGCCISCFGEIGLSLPAKTNLGFSSASTILGKFVQLLLSAKHVILSSVASIRDLSDIKTAIFLRASDVEHDNTIYLKSPGDKCSIKITLSAAESHMIADLKHVDNIDDLSASHMTAIKNVLFTITNNSNPDDYSCHLIKIGDQELTTSFSIEMLKHIQDNGYTIDEHGNYEILMDNWDYSQSFLYVPLSLFSTPLYIAGIDNFLTNASDIKDINSSDKVVEKTTVDSLGVTVTAEDREEISTYMEKGSKGIVGAKNRLTNYKTVTEGVNALYELVSEKMDVNIAHLEVMVMSLTAEDPSGWDFRPPLDRYNATLIEYSDAMRYRSMSQVLAFEYQANGMYDISAFLVKNRADHPYDELFE